MWESMDPSVITKNYTFPMLTKLLGTHKSDMIYDSEFVNGLVVKAIEKCSSDTVILAEMDFFLDRYFTQLESNLHIPPDDLSTIIGHLISKIKRIAQSNVILTPKSRGSRSKQNKSATAEAEMPPEDVEYCTRLAIDAATSLVTFCPKLITAAHYKSLVSHVVSELLSINEHRLDGLASLPGRPYVNDESRASLLLLLQSLTLITQYPEHHPLNIALAIFEKFGFWETSLEIKKTCKRSIRILMVMARSTVNSSIASSAESNVIVNTMPNKVLSPIAEEPNSPKEASTASSNGVNLIEFSHEEKRAEEESAKNCEKEGDDPVVIDSASDENNLMDRSIQVDGVVASASSRSSRSISASSFYMTATDLTANNDATIVEMDVTIPSTSACSSPTLTPGLNQTTFQEKNMSLEKSAFHHTIYLEENSCPQNDDEDDDIMIVNSQSHERDTYASPAKRLKEDNGLSGDSNGKSFLTRSTYTLLPSAVPITSQPVPNLIDDSILESVEDIMHTSNLDE